MLFAKLVHFFFGSLHTFKVRHFLLLNFVFMFAHICFTRSSLKDFFWLVCHFVLPFLDKFGTSDSAHVVAIFLLLFTLFTVSHGDFNALWSLVDFFNICCFLLFFVCSCILVEVTIVVKIVIFFYTTVWIWVVNYFFFLSF